MCEDCDRNRTSIPFIVYEAEMLRSEKRFRRMIVLVVISVFALFASNIAWIMYLTRCDHDVEDRPNTTAEACYVGEREIVTTTSTEYEDSTERQYRRQDEAFEILKRGGG